ncbi:MULTISPECIES: hypothetical protein [Chitinophagaceae]
MKTTLSLCLFIVLIHKSSTAQYTNMDQGSTDYNHLLFAVTRNMDPYVRSHTTHFSDNIKFAKDEEIDDSSNTLLWIDIQRSFNNDWQSIQYTNDTSSTPHIENKNNRNNEVYLSKYILAKRYLKELRRVNPDALDACEHAHYTTLKTFLKKQSKLQNNKS